MSRVSTVPAFDRTSFVAGIVEGLPLAAPVVPFGLVLGFIIGEISAVDDLAGWASSWVVFGGSSQLAAVNLLDEGASAIVVVVTIAMINARHLMYSAALSPRFADVPMVARVAGSYLLNDQVFALTDAKPHGIDLQTRLWTYAGTTALFWTLWQTSVGVGLLLGDVIPESWSLTFSVVLLFGGLMVLSVRDRPSLVAAVVGGLVGLLARDFPQGLGLLVAIVAGVGAGALAERLWGSAPPTNQEPTSSEGDPS